MISFKKADFGNSTEPTREEAFARFLTDESLNNVVLESKDGQHIRANRHILASRSEVFHKMLLGDFAEAAQDSISIGFDGSVLRALVKYILTDKIAIAGALTENTEEVSLKAVECIHDIVALIGAASYFNLPTL